MFEHLPKVSAHTIRTADVDVNKLVDRIVESLKKEPVEAFNILCAELDDSNAELGIYVRHCTSGMAKFMENKELGIPRDASLLVMYSYLVWVLSTLCVLDKAAEAQSQRRTPVTPEQRMEEYIADMQKPGEMEVVVADIKASPHTK